MLTHRLGLFCPLFSPVGAFFYVAPGFAGASAISGVDFHSETGVAREPPGQSLGRHPTGVIAVNEYNWGKLARCGTLC